MACNYYNMSNPLIEVRPLGLAYSVPLIAHVSIPLIAHVPVSELIWHFHP